jgi:hypothetical protein
MKMMNDKNDYEDKQDCIESITRVLEKTSAWRQAVIARHPEDARNVKAVRALNRLAADAVNLTDEHWGSLKPYFGGGWNSHTWRNGLNQTAKQIGFWHRAGDLDIFVKIIIQNMSASSVAA